MRVTFVRAMLLPIWWHSDVEQGEHLEGCVQEPTTHGINNLVSAKIPKKITRYTSRDMIFLHLCKPNNIQ